MTTRLVSVKRQGCILQVEPDCSGILSPYLTYMHRAMEPGAVGRRRKYTFTPTPLFEVKDGALYCGQGFLFRVNKVLTEAGYQVEFKDLREGELSNLVLDEYLLAKLGPEFKLREAQELMLAKILQWDSGIFVLPTGTGKTTFLKFLTLVFPKDRFLIATPEQGLAIDAHASLTQLLGVNNVGGLWAGKNDIRHRPRVLVTCAFSLSKCPLDEVQIFIFDEVHRSAAPVFHHSLSRIGGLKKCRIYGMTATPRGRHDAADLVVESFFGPILYTSQYQEEVARGTVAQIKVYLVPSPLGPAKLSGSPVSRDRWAVWRNRPRNELIVKSALWAKKEFGEDVQILIHVDKVEHGLILAQMLPDFKFTSANVEEGLVYKLKNGGYIKPDWTPLSKEARLKLRRDFCAGIERRVIATNYNTGIDAPELRVAILASGKSSAIRVPQEGGRTSRVLDGDRKEEKPYSVVIDLKDVFHPSVQRRTYLRLKEFKQRGWEIIDAPFIAKGKLNG